MSFLSFVQAKRDTESSIFSKFGYRPARYDDLIVLSDIATLSLPGMTNLGLDVRFYHSRAVCKNIMQISTHQLFRQSGLIQRRVAVTMFKLLSAPHGQDRCGHLAAVVACIVPCGVFDCMISSAKRP